MGDAVKLEMVVSAYAPEGTMATTAKLRTTGANHLLVSMVPLALTMERACSANVLWVMLEKDVRKVRR